MSFLLSKVFAILATIVAVVTLQQARGPVPSVSPRSTTEQVNDTAEPILTRTPIPTKAAPVRHTSIPTNAPAANYESSPIPTTFVNPTPTPVVYDACKNIYGIQGTVPAGMYADGNGNCLNQDIQKTNQINALTSQYRRSYKF